ncbi:ABC transporter transmembrane domain-containing protein [Paenibacillus dendritiformis]|uniref:ABC transporter transmembrane domain-containing protein n=1 Tax=Paenibacillus dendritiformis TaxID=130049 RepID=UPI00248A915D|nr:ABC transporter transmembrane domain-containing protein [Paenibacillus dendritiformis]WGU96278.1 ABC transporter transmembrane domain-containing protein [Paenibacillus dendritiformis]
MLTRMLSYARQYKKHMLLAASILIVTTLIELIPPYITKVIVDDVLQPRNIGTALLWLVIALACTEIVLVIGQIARGYLGVRIGARLMGEIRSDVYRSLMGMSLAFFDRRQTSQFISRVNNDSEQMRQFLTDGLIWVGGNAVKFIAIIVMMLSLDWQLTLFAILPMPLIIFSLCGYSRRFGSCGTGNGAPSSI